MQLRFIGNKAQGYLGVVDKIPDKGLVISIGVGSKFSFEKELYERKACRVICYDPSEKTKKVFERNELSGINLISKALFIDTDKLYIHGTYLYLINPTGTFKEVDYITMPWLLNTYKNIDVLKLNIGGCEYYVFNSIDTIDVPQIIIRFHHNRLDIPFTVNNTIEIICKLNKLGYRMFQNPLDDLLNENRTFTATFVKD